MNANIITEVIREGVLNDDLLHIAPKNKVFKGGYKAIIEYYTYANEWSDRKHYRRFRTIENAENYIDKHYKQAIPVTWC